MSPFGETALCVSLNARGWLSPLNSRLPLPSSRGKVNVRISSTRPAASKACTSSVLPCVTRTGPSSCFSFATSLAASRSATEPFQVRSTPLRRNVLGDSVEGLRDVVGRPAFGIGPVRGEDIVGAPPEQQVERLAEQHVELFAENLVVPQCSGPAAELEAAGGIFFRSAGGLHHTIY